jgi:hypothetical protein
MIEKPIIMWICISIIILMTFGLLCNKKITYNLILQVGIIGGILGVLIVSFGYVRHRYFTYKPFIYNDESTCRCHKRKENIYPECFHCNSQPYENY